MTTVTVTVDDEVFPIEWEAVTASQMIGAHRSTGASVGEVVARGGFLPNGLAEVVAMVLVSCDQRGLPSDPGWIGDRVTLSSAVAFAIDADEAPVVPAPVTPGAKDAVLRDLVREELATALGSRTIEAADGRPVTVG